MNTSNSDSFELLRQEFPATNERAYLQSAYRGLLPARTVSRITELLHDHAVRGADARDEWFETYEIAGRSLASWMGSKFENLVYVPNTSTAMSLIAHGLNWQSGDEVLIPGLEFPANVYPWMQLERHGVGLRVVQADAEGRTSADAIIQALRPNTRLVSLSHVNFTTGYRMEIRKLADALRDAGVICVLDAAQSVGWAALDFEDLGVDVLTGVMRKFFCAMDGLDFMLIRPELADRLRVSLPGPFSVVHDREYLNHKLDLKSGAQKFLNGAIATPQAYAIEESVQLFQKVGRAKIEARCLQLSHHLRKNLAERGVPYIGQAWQEQEHSAVVTIALTASDALRSALRAEKLSVSVRGSGVRVGIHAFNTEAELDRLASVAARFAH